ncbi:hypothetical protein LZ31DRAFT_634256, partial [Colletotrichum somersetense]
TPPAASTSYLRAPAFRRRPPSPRTSSRGPGPSARSPIPRTPSGRPPRARCPCTAPSPTRSTCGGWSSGRTSTGSFKLAKRKEAKYGEVSYIPRRRQRRVSGGRRVFSSAEASGLRICFSSKVRYRLRRITNTFWLKGH